MTVTFKKYGLSLMFFGAAFIHLFSPQYFLPAIPSFIQFPDEIIFLTGLLEIVLALGLLIHRTQNLTAQISAMYLILLIPVHIYVSVFSIEIFGIHNTYVLWARTLFQFVLIFWVLTRQTTGWIIKQQWRNVFFIHYKVDPLLIAGQVPFKLDLYEGQAVISIVPFLMDGIRFPFFPPIPKISRLWELNLRTYVEVNGIKGIYFFTLETDSKIGELIAKNFFNLPYQYSKIKAEINQDHYHFNHNRKEFSFELEATIGGPLKKSNFDLWATERYSLFTQKNGITYQGKVDHVPWELQQVEISKLSNQFTKMVIPDIAQISSASFSRTLEVKFKPFVRIG